MKFEQTNCAVPASQRRIAIVGSCVSRDPFELATELEFGAYIARSSFASMFAPPFDIQFPLERIPSKWQHAMVEADIYKEASSLLTTASPSGVLIDFIDERFSLLEHNGTVATLSLPLSILVGKDYGSAQVVRPHSEEYKLLWRKGWSAFVSLVRSLGCSDKCILHKVWYAEIDTNGESFSPGMVAAGNRNLGWCYETAQKLMPELRVIEIPRELLVCDANHRWGRAPYHYIKEEQEYLLRCLEAAMGNVDFRFE